MRKCGVFFLLTGFVFSSLLFFSNMTLSSNAPLIKENISTEEEIIEKPQMSLYNKWDYFPEEIIYEWEDLQSKIAQSNVEDITTQFTNPDNGYTSTQLPFMFKFYQGLHSSVNISTNGYISFSEAAPIIANNPEFPQSGAGYNDIIAPFWDNIDLNKGGSVFIANLTDRWVLEYKDVYHYDWPNIGSFEVTLHKDGSIQFNYEHINYIIEGYTLGINLGDGQKHVQFDVLQANTYYRSFEFKREFIVFEDDFEGIINSKWSGINTGNYWHITDTDNHSASHSLWCANASSGTYEKSIGGVDQIVKESVTIKDIDLKYYCDATLSFWFKKITENSPSYDYFNISARINSNHFYLSPRYTNNQHYISYINTDYSQWTFMDLNLSFFCGFDHIDLIFTFDTYDNVSNNYSGFKMDDVKINASRCFMPIFNAINIEEGDEFQFNGWVDSELYEQYFGESPSWGDEDRCKIKIMTIVEYELYWDITARFWDWTSDWEDKFDNIGDSEEKHYYIYKFGINMKAGTDFFIPVDVEQYLQNADNLDQWSSKFFVEHYWNYDDNRYNYELRFDNIIARRSYREDGVLRGIEIFTNNFWNSIYNVWLIDWEEGNNEDDGHDEDEEFYVNIPGYDLYIILLLFCGTTAIFIKRGFNSKKK